MVDLITDSFDTWISAQAPKTNGNGNGNGAAYGIRKLRELILELAVRGKLVPQDPNDEPASVLLQKIAKEKARLVKEGKIKKEKPLPEIMEDEKPFELPQGWEWARLHEIAQHNSGKTLDGSRNTGCLRDYITTSNLYWGYFVLDDLRQMPITDEELDRCSAERGDLLICEGGEAGRTAVWNYSYDICFQNHIHRVRPYGGIDPYYLYRIFQKMSYTGEIDSHRKGVGISNMSGKSLALVLIPLPPIACEHRIVAKVDELMTLCDQLEQQQRDNSAAHQALVETLLATLTAAANPAEFTEAWQRVAEHFDTLFTTEQSIDQLKKTILQLAVMGKLVHQDPNDEPASVLLKRIKEERKRLTEKGKIKRTESLPRIGPNEEYCRLPLSWAWARLDDFAIHSEAGWSPKCESLPRKGREWAVIKVSAVTWGRFDPTENKALPDDLEPRREFEIMPGDFLISRANTAELVARSVVVPNEVPAHLTLSDKTIRFVFSENMNAQYVCLVNNGPFSRKYYARVAGGTSGSMKNVSREQIRALVVPLPPLLNSTASSQRSMNS